MQAISVTCNQVPKQEAGANTITKKWGIDPLSRAKLNVSFFWPFSGGYWIIDLGQEYEYAVVGHPQRKYLWILSREETMEEGTYQTILARLAEQHYDITKIIKSDQGE